VERRQVFDLPPVKAEVTEHQLIERECRCGHRTKAAAPEGAEAPVQYGPRIAAIIVYLYIGQFLSKNRTAQTLAELFGIPLSSGTVAALTARAAGKLDGFLQQVREHITASPVAGFDETGFRVQGADTDTTRPAAADAAAAPLDLLLTDADTAMLPRDALVILSRPGRSARQLHQVGAQATAASTRSAFVTESSPSHALMAPANPWATNCAMTWWLASGRSGWVDLAMNATL
jgi:Transposase IS66 family